MFNDITLSYSYIKFIVKIERSVPITHLKKYFAIIYTKCNL